MTLPAPRAPHYDGSPLYVPNPEPTLGEKVRVRICLPACDDLNGVTERLDHPVERASDGAVLISADGPVFAAWALRGVVLP